MMLGCPPLTSSIQYAKIDSVLTQDELKDDEKLKLAERFAEQHNEKWLWVIAGCAVSVISWAGLSAGKENQNSHD